MSRPVQPIGTFGTIAVKKVRERTFYASTRFRAYNGGYIRFSATGATDGAAQRELKRKLADYTEAQKADGITNLSPLSDVAAIWLHEISTAERLSPQTVDAYADNLRAVLLPDVGKMRLSELTVGVLDRYFKHLAVDHPSRARRGKIVLSQVITLAVRHDAIRANPVQMTGPLKKPLNEVKVLSIDELTHIRRIIAEWRTAGTVMGPKPNGQLALIFDVILGTGARIGEALAIRACDVDFSAGTVTISGTIVPRRGSGLVRQNHPKHTKHWRTVTVPPFVVAALKAPWEVIDTSDPDSLVFQTRNGTILSPANVRRQWRSIRAGREDLPANIDLGKVTPHVLRKTAADAVDKKIGTRIAADMLGHSSTAVAEEYYVRPVKQVDPATADALQSLGPALPTPLLPFATQMPSPDEAVQETRPTAYRRKGQQCSQMLAGCAGSQSTSADSDARKRRMRPAGASKATPDALAQAKSSTIHSALGGSSSKVTISDSCKWRRASSKERIFSGEFNGR